MKKLLLTAVFGFCSTVPAQGQILQVDAKGQAGPHKTIMAAVNLAKSGDQIWIHPGVYPEDVVVDGKSLTLLGVGKKTADVVIAGVSSTFLTPVLTIKKVPQGGRFVVSRISLGSIYAAFTLRQGFLVEACAGDLFFDEVESQMPNTCAKVTATVSVHRCKLGTVLSGGRYGMSVLTLDQVKLCLIQSSELKNSAGLGSHCSGLTATKTALDISHSVISGAYGFQGIGPQVYSGGYGIWLQSSTAFLRGKAADTITGGGAPIGMGSPADGGDAIHMNSSQLTWSGVTMTAGVGNTTGKKFALVLSTAVQSQPPLPILASGGSFSAGAQTSFEVQAEPASVSVTWLTLGLRPLLTPVGYLVADLQTLLLPMAVVHDAKGLATVTLDLRNIDRRHIGDAFVLQSLCMDTKFRLSLTNALVPVVH